MWDNFGQYNTSSSGTSVPASLGPSIVKDAYSSLSKYLPQYAQVNGGMPAASLVDSPNEAPFLSLERMLGKTTVDKNGAQIRDQGWGMPALQAATGAFNAWMGMKNYGLAKRQLAENQQQFGLNFDAQRTTTNSQLEDRQRARVASNAGAYQSVGEYMGQNGIKARG